MNLRRVCCVGVIMGALVLMAPLGHADDGPVAAWWSRSNIGLVPSSGEPGVSGDQLLVEGAAGSEDGWLAVSAVAFTIDAGVSDATLSLTASSVGGSAPPVLCAITKPFEAARGGPWQDVPAHDCSHSITATTSGDGHLVFAGVGRIATDGAVRALIVPGGPGRTVIDVPSAESLSVVSPPGSPGPRTSSGSRASAPVTASHAVVGPNASAAAVPPPTSAAAPASAPRTSAPVVAAAQRTSSDFRARALTAAALAVLLGAFTAMQRGSSSRLRPRRVAWAKAETTG